MKFEQSESSAGRASHVVSAGSGGAPPPPPPSMLPIGVRAPEPVDIKVYPPGGQIVDSEIPLSTEFEEEKTPKQNKTATKDDKIYKNFEEPIFLAHDSSIILSKLSPEDWILKFIQIGGFEFFYDLIMKGDSLISQRLDNLDFATDIEKDCISHAIFKPSMLILGAFIANEDNLLPSVEIIKDNKSTKKNSLTKVEEDQEMDIDEDGYEIDEEKLLKDVKPMEPTRERTVSTIAKEDDMKQLDTYKKEIQDLVETCNPAIIKNLTGEYGEKILKGIKYESLIKKFMKCLTNIFSKRNLSDKDKLIGKLIISTMTPLLTFNENLLTLFYNFYDEDTKTDLKELIIKGLTFSSDRVVKSLMERFITILCSIVKQTKEVRLPLMVILEFFKEHFFETIKEASKFYGYQEFYNTFTQLFVKYLSLKKERNKKFENIIEPKIFSKQIINILKDYKTKEKRNTVLEDHCLIGLFSLLEQIIIDDPELIEELALNQGLLHEIFFDCLFTEAVEAPKIDVTPSFDANSSKHIVSLIYYSRIAH